MSIDTPNMGLIKPDVGIEVGPTWATQINTSLDTLDVHDHSSGKGIKITPQGLNINTDLDIQDNDVINVEHVRLIDTTPSGINGVFQSDGDLYWLNEAGVNVQITAGNTINVGSVGTIGGDYSTDPLNPSITYTTATGDYDFYKQTAGSTIVGGVNAGTLTIFEEAAGTNGISIASPTSLVSAYSITLPATQASVDNMTISVSSAGVYNYTRDILADTQGLGNGLVSTPSLYGEFDTDTGVYWSLANVLGIAAGGAASALFTSTALLPGATDARNLGSGSAIWDDAYINRTRFASGTQTNPTLTFESETNTGIYKAAAGVLAYTILGTARYAMTATAFRPSLTNTYDLGSNSNRWDNGYFDRLLVANGSQTTPSIAFIDDANDNLGFFRVAENQLGFASNNITAMRMTQNELVPGTGGLQNLGSSATRWNTIYGITINATGTLNAGATTIAGLTCDNINCIDITGNDINCVDLEPTGALTSKLENGVSTTFVTVIATGSGTTSNKQYSYSRVGDTVQLSGVIEGSYTMSGVELIIEVELPIASNLTSSRDVAGSLVSSAGTHTMTNGKVDGEVTNDRARLIVQDNGGGSPSVATITFSLAYRIK